ncbi:MAG: bifunctional DNA-formamidopyrimidine glycosylase/DNA-(apurinic or apyrimidinic site) lyase [Limisphaerales bacterium]
MPELPEVEILARHLNPLLQGHRVRNVRICRARIVRPGTEADLNEALRRARFTAVSRRGKYLVFELSHGTEKQVLLIGHLGMTGRFFVTRAGRALPKHTAAIIEMGKRNLVFEDYRYFGRLTLDDSVLAALGPEPLGAEFTAAYLADALKRSQQAIKVKLLDQALVAGVGNIYASEALFHARLAPTLPSRKLTQGQIRQLRLAIRHVLTKAIQRGSTLPLDYSGSGQRDGLFYFGTAAEAQAQSEERLQVYDRAGHHCSRCGTPIQRVVQCGRSTFFCPKCQRR